MFGLTTKEVKVTDSATAHFKNVMSGLAGLRLSILEGKGCGGNEYDLKPLTESEIDAGDDFISLNETCNLYIPPMDMIKLFGTEIDYIEDDLGNRRIHISNPNETGKCGCGKSVTF